MKTYLKPSIDIVNVRIQNALMNISRFEKEISSNNAGLVKENNYSGRNNPSVWDDDWSQ